MRIPFLKNRFVHLLFVSILITSFCRLQASEFDCMVVPSLMDQNMDGWYKIPINSEPYIQKASSVFQGQLFTLFVFFRGSTADKENNLHLKYDVQIYDPQGKPTEDKADDVLAYEGHAGNPDVIILSQQSIGIVFTKKYPLGTYKIKVTAHDKVANKSFSLETPIELVPFTLPEKFKSQEDAGKWAMGYYNSPTPINAIRGVQALVQCDEEWQNENLNILAFFRIIFSNNQFLLENLAKNFNTFPKEEQKKFLLISAISSDSILTPLLTGNDRQELREFYNKAKKIQFPDLSGEINSPIQLDILWAEFLATGKYEPIKKIVGALALKKYEGAIAKLESGEPEKMEATEKQAYLEVTYKSAVWSIVSNCKQMPLVHKYCVYMYKNENLSEDVKKQLGSILYMVQKEIQDSKDKKSTSSSSKYSTTNTAK